MLERGQFCLFLFILNFPLSLLQTLQQNVGTASTNNNLGVLGATAGANQVDQITPDSLKVPEIIQQIDVKDEGNQVISNISQVNVSDDSDDPTNTLNKPYDTNPEDTILKVDNVTVTGLQNNQGNNSDNILLGQSQVNANGANSSLKTNNSNLVTKSLDNDTYTDIAFRSDLTVKGNNKEVSEDVIGSYSENTTLKSYSQSNNNLNLSLNQNNDTKTVNDISNFPLLNTTLLNEHNDTVQNLNNTYTSTRKINLSVNLGNPNINFNENTTTDLDNTIINDKYTNPNDYLLNNNTPAEVNNEYDEISWRSDFPKKKTNVATDINNLESISSISDDTKSPSVGNTRKGLSISDEGQESKTDVETNQKSDSIFMIINSGIIQGFSANAPASGDSSILETNEPKLNPSIKTNNSYVANDNSDLITNLINSTINKVASNILQQNLSDINPNNVFLILNSGYITNFQVNSPVLKNLKNSTTLIDRSKRDLNNTTVKAVTLKPPSDESLDPIFVIKFRTGENENLNSNETTHNKSVTKKSLDANLDLNATESDDLQYNITNNNSSANLTVEENALQDKDISSAEAPAFRTSITNKKINSTHIPNVVTLSSDLINNSLNLVQPFLKPETLGLDLNNFSVFNDAIGMIKRLKRNSNVKNERHYPWKANNEKGNSYQLDIDELVDKETEEPCDDSTKSPYDELLIKMLKSNRRSFDKSKDRPKINNELKENFGDVECPLSFFVKIALHQLMDKISQSKSGLISDIYLTLKSLIEGGEDPFNLLSHELWNSPFPVQLRLQLLHGDTRDFIDKLSKYLDAALCLFYS